MPAVEAPDFTVVTDNSKRIVGFNPAGHDSVIPPRAMIDYLSGDDRLMHGGQEYNITEKGSLIHVGVDVPASFTAIGSGALIGADTVFAENDRYVEISDHARVSGTTLSGEVYIGEHAVVLDSIVERSSILGSYTRIRQTKIGNNVRAQHAVKIDRESEIGDDTLIRRAARLGYKTIVGSHVIIGERSLVGVTNGGLTEGMATEGLYIADGKIIPPKTRVHSDVY